MLLRMKIWRTTRATAWWSTNLISYDLLKFSSRSAAMVSSAGTISVMMNEEDHVRFQGLLPGLQLERSAEMALQLDEKVGEDYPFAFDTQWGLSDGPARRTPARHARLRDPGTCLRWQRGSDGRGDCSPWRSWA